jgi:thiol-disulfide isomerase/thioredoxin
MCLSISNELQAQQIKPLSIGDKLPEVQFSSIYNNRASKVSTQDFIGKTILIDFWATWCSPCVRSLNFLDSLQMRYKDDLVVICTTKEDSKLVREVMHKLFVDKSPTFLTVFNENILEQYFPHQSIPHCVWIDRDGKVKAITNKAEVTDKNISDFVNQTKLQLTNKVTETKYDQHRPPYASKQLLLADEFLYHSMFTKYRADLNSSISRGADNTFISCINAPITRLYQCAFGKFDLAFLDMNKIVCLGISTLADSVEIGLFKSNTIIKLWEKQMDAYAYSYELATKDTIFSKDQLFHIMQDDLNKFFISKGIEGHIEKRPVKIMALTEISTDGKYKSNSNNKPAHYLADNFLKVENEPISFFLTQLQAVFNTDFGSLKNETGYKGKVSLELNNSSNDLSSLNKELAKYGLALKKKTEMTDIIVITKSAKQAK